MNSLAIRLAAAFVGLVAVVALVFAAVGFAAASSGVNTPVDQFLIERADELVRGERGQPARDGDDNDNDGDDSSGDGNGNGRPRDGRRNDSVGDDSVVQTLDEGGVALTTTGVSLPIEERDVELAGSKSNDTWLRTVDTVDGPFRMITAAVPAGGAVQVARALTESNTIVDLIRGRLTLAVPLVALAAALAGVFLARRITGPLRSLASTVDAVAATGNLAVPIEVAGNDEVGRLAAGFDNLLRSLSRSRVQQQQLVQDAAHELRTPLTSVKANVEFLAAAPDLRPEVRHDTLASVQSELRELSRLVDEIVDVATDRFVPQQFGPTDLAEAAAEAIERFRVRNRARVIEADLTPTPVRGDPDSLVRAIGNLLSNADKYSPPDQPISVRVGNGGTFSVADRGPGVQPDERERIFDRFYRSDGARSQPGSGLGLAIVASIVQAHGGVVAVDDNPGGGAILSFSLPH